MTSPLQTLLAENAKVVEECEKLATLDIRFDGPPGPVAGRFVEAERGGKSVNAGEWVQEGNDWILRIQPGTADLCARNKELCALVEELSNNIPHESYGYPPRQCPALVDEECNCRKLKHIREALERARKKAGR